MSVRDNARRKLLLWAAFGALGSALFLSFILEENFGRWFNNGAPGNPFVEGRVLGFLERNGWKPQAEKVTVEKVGNNLGKARAVLLYKSHDGVSVPGVLFLVGGQYVLVGRLFDLRTGRDLSPELFGKVPVTFDLKKMNLDGAHKRGSSRPKVVIVEYGDYGCEACAKLEKILSPLLDNYPEVQHVYKHYPMSEGSRYLAEVAEAVSVHGEKYFWELHRRIFSANKNGWDQRRTERFVVTQLEEMGVDPKKIRRAVESGEPRKRVSQDQAEFSVAETPTLVIDGEVVVGALGYGELKTIIEEKSKGQAR